MKIFLGIAIPETKEEEYLMADIALKIVMNKINEAEQLAKDNNLLPYYEAALKEHNNEYKHN